MDKQNEAWIERELKNHIALGAMSAKERIECEEGMIEGIKALKDRRGTKNAILAREGLIQRLKQLEDK